MESPVIGQDTFQYRYYLHDSRYLLLCDVRLMVGHDCGNASGLVLEQKTISTMSSRE